MNYIDLECFAEPEDNDLFNINKPDNEDEQQVQCELNPNELEPEKLLIEDNLVRSELDPDELELKNLLESHFYSSNKLTDLQNEYINMLPYEKNMTDDEKQQFVNSLVNIKAIFLEKFNKITSMDIKQKIKMLKYLKRVNVWDLPASSNFHSNYPGGLIIHSCLMADVLEDYTKSASKYDSLRWNKPDAPIIISLFHDLCKTDSYTTYKFGFYSVHPTTGKKIWNDMTMFKSLNDGCGNNPEFGYHGDKSAIMLMALLGDMDFDKQIIGCIRYHMGPSSESALGQRSYFQANKKCPEISWAYKADERATNMEKILTFK